MRLHSYFRSSAAFRVRIALNLKGLAYDIVPVSLTAGQQRSEAYLQVNPEGLVPALELDDGQVLTQSPAILEWLEEQYPAPALYPTEPLARARMRATCHHVACDIHPINNLRVLRYLEHPLGVPEPARRDWYHHWVRVGFSAIEPTVEGPFQAGRAPSMADVYLVPQLFNAARFGVDMAPFPRLSSLYQHAFGHAAFHRAHPDQQPDRIS